MTISFTDDQKRAYSLLQSSDNVFLTGGGGVGKSTLIRAFLESEENYHKSAYVVASTGAAALLVDGMTFHSFFGLGIHDDHRKLVANALTKDKVVERLRDCDILVLDEVSMITGSLLQVAECIACNARDSDEPWGGIKIVTVGDFAQLPPVTRNGAAVDWAFKNPIWQHSNFKMAHLTTVMRTSDRDFIEILKEIRFGRVTPRVISFLNSRVTKEDLSTFDGTRLFARRDAVEAYNMKRLNLLDAPLMTFPTEFRGPPNVVEGLKKDLRIPEILQLKEDALVMIIKNAQDLSYCNGSLAHVVGVDTFKERHLELTKQLSENHRIAAPSPRDLEKRDEIEARMRLDDRQDYLIVKLVTGSTIRLGKNEFKKTDANGNVLASAKNYPVILAWATTIHKAQGASIDRLAITITDLFETGQAYVAISRARSPEGLFIEKWNPRDIRANHEVKEFYAELDNAVATG